MVIDPQTLRLQVDNFFEQVKNNKSFHVGETVINAPHPTVTGLALFLGLPSKQSLKTYCENPLYEEAMRYALLRAENVYEIEMLRGNTNMKVLLEWFGGWKDMITSSTNFTFAQLAKDVYDEEQKNRISEIS